MCFIATRGADTTREVLSRTAGVQGKTFWLDFPSSEATNHELAMRWDTGAGAQRGALMQGATHVEVLADGCPAATP